jgi:hypothetical protein
VLELIMTRPAVALAMARMRDFVRRMASTTVLADDKAHPASLKLRQTS